MPRVKKRKKRFVDTSRLVQILRSNPDLRPNKGDSRKCDGKFWKLATLLYGPGQLSEGETQAVYDCWKRNREQLTIQTDAAPACAEEDLGNSDDEYVCQSSKDDHEKNTDPKDLKSIPFTEEDGASSTSNDFDSMSEFSDNHEAASLQVEESPQRISFATASPRRFAVEAVDGIVQVSDGAKIGSSVLEAFEQSEPFETVTEDANLPRYEKSLPHFLRRVVKTPGRLKEYMVDRFSRRTKRGLRKDVVCDESGCKTPPTDPTECTTFQDAGAASRKRGRYEEQELSDEEDRKFCVCQGPDEGLYMECEVQTQKCLKYYHPECIGFPFTTPEAVKKFSNCPDGTSFICSLCSEVLRKCGILGEGSSISRRFPRDCSHSSMCSFPDDDHISPEAMEQDLSDEKRLCCSSISEEEKEGQEEEGQEEQEEHQKQEQWKVELEQEEQVSGEGEGACSSARDDKKLQQTDENKERNLTLETLKHMMGCKDLPSGEYFEAELQCQTQLKLSKKELEKLRPAPASSNKLNPSWTRILKARIAETANPYCVLEMKRHWLPKFNSRKQRTEIVFKAKGQCRFSDCPVQVVLEMKKGNEETGIIDVLQSGKVRHAASERRSVSIRGEERKDISKIFEETNIRPSTLYNKKLATRNVSAMAAGNQSGAGIKVSTLQKIASEARGKAHRLDSDVHQSLLKVQQTTTKKEKERNPMAKKVEGYIQTLSSAKDLIVHMWTERQVRLWHELCQKGASYLDATGTVVGNWNGKRVLYYALVVTNLEKRVPPLPVAEMLSTSHNVPTITNFINSFRYHEMQVFGYGNNRIPRQVNTDRGRALMLSTIKSFNTEDMPSFLSRAFRIVTRKASIEDFEKMIPHVCCSHMMKDFHAKIKQTAGDSRFVSFFLYACSLLVNAKSLEEIAATYREVIRVFSNKHQSSEVNGAYQRLCKKANNLGKVTDEEIKDISNHQGKEKKWETTGTVDGGPFAEYFEVIYQEEMENKKEMAFYASRNACYNTGLLEYIRSALPICPFWTGLLLGSLRRYKPQANKDKAKVLTFTHVDSKTQGPIENYFKIMKSDDFRGKTRLRPDEFLLQQYDFLDARIVGFAESFRLKKPSTKTTIVDPNESSSRCDFQGTYEMAEEEWNKPTIKRPQNNTGKYQKPPTYKLPSVPGPVKDTEKIKSGFQLFLEKSKQKRNGKNIMKTLAKEWNQLPEDQRQNWREMAIWENNRSAQNKSSHARSLQQGDEKGQRHLTSGTRYVGLENYGNSCWLNSLLQCLSHLQLSSRITSDIHTTSGGDVANLLAQTLYRMHQGRKETNIHENLYETFIHKHKWSTGQQDAEEGLMFLLDDINENAQGDLVYNSTCSVISTFKTCQECETTTHLTDQPMLVLPLTVETKEKKCSGPDGVNSKAGMQDLVDKYFEDELLTKQCCEVTCEKCKTVTDHLQISQLACPPEVLILSLKRYSARKSKIMTRIRLDPIITTKHGDDKEEQYKLKAIVLHTGKIPQRGHYKTVIVDESGIFVELDDETVIRHEKNYATSKEMESNCYIIFFEKEGQGQDLPSSKPKLQNIDEIGREENNGLPLNKHESVGADEKQQETEKKKEVEKKIELMMNVQSKDKELTNINKQAIYGRDLKTLEYPQVDFSYSLATPRGYLNDVVLQATCALINQEAKQRGIIVKTFDSNFNGQLERLCIDTTTNPNEKETELLRLIKKLKRCKVGETAFFILPQHKHGCHWTVCVVNDSQQATREIVIYDPDPKSTKSTTASFVELLSLYIDLATAEYSNPYVPYKSKSLTWRYETSFPSQKDSNSCGIYCLIYIRMVTCLQYLDSNVAIDTDKARKEIARGLLTGAIDWSFAQLKENDDLKIAVKPPWRYHLTAGQILEMMCVAQGKGNINYEWTDEHIHTSVLGRERKFTHPDLTKYAEQEPVAILCSITDESYQEVSAKLSTVVMTSDLALKASKLTDRGFINSKLRAFLRCEREDNPSTIDEIIEETEKVILAYKEYLLDIAAKRSVKDCKGKQFQRHRAFLKRDHNGIDQGKTEVLGLAHLGDEVVESIRTTITNMFEITDVNDLRPELNTVQYVYKVLASEAIVKYIMDKEKCSYEKAEKLAYHGM